MRVIRSDILRRRAIQLSMRIKSFKYIDVKSERTSSIPGLATCGEHQLESVSFSMFPPRTRVHKMPFKVKSIPAVLSDGRLLICDVDYKLIDDIDGVTSIALNSSATWRVDISYEVI